MAQVIEKTEDKTKEVKQKYFLNLIDREVKDSGLVRRILGFIDIELYDPQFKGFLGRKLARSLGTRVMKVDYTDADKRFNIYVFDGKYTSLAHKLADELAYCSCDADSRVDECF